MVSMLEKKYMYGYTLAEQVNMVIGDIYIIYPPFPGLVHLTVLQPPRPIPRAALQVQQTDLYPVSPAAHGGVF